MTKGIRVGSLRYSSILILIIVVSFGQTRSGWSQCIDSTVFTVQNPICQPTFEPVCGCDGITYNNDCYAMLQGGVLTWQPGPCGSIAANHYPDPSSGLHPFYVQVVNRYEDDINIEVKDLNGMIYFQDHYSMLTELQVTYDLSGFPRGLYFMFIYNNSEFIVRKFMVWGS